MYVNVKYSRPNFSNGNVTTKCENGSDRSCQLRGHWVNSHVESECFNPNRVPDHSLIEVLKSDSEKNPEKK